MLLPQDVCTCSSLCLKSSLPRESQGPLSHILQFFAQIQFLSEAYMKLHLPHVINQTLYLLALLYFPP